MEVDLNKRMQQRNDTLSAHGIDVPLAPPGQLLQGLNSGLPTLLTRELEYDADALRQEAASSVERMNVDQRHAFDSIMSSITNSRENGVGSFYFIDAPGGTGKTFLAKAILSHVRSQKKIAIAMASSGIASLLLPGGRTVHSRLKVPIKLDDASVCNVTPRSQVAELIRQTEIILWDEAPMAHRNMLEAINRTFKDIMGNDSIFGGKVMVCMGDFRQTLPIIRRASKAVVVRATFKSSKLWENVTCFKLTINERILRLGASPHFSNWLLKMGNGELQGMQNIYGEPLIEIPREMLIMDDNDNPSERLTDLIKWCYPNIVTNYTNRLWMQGRAILTTKNSTVDE